MFYYKIFPASKNYKADTPLVYSSGQKITTGKLVTISLRARTVAGIVLGSTTKPRMSTKNITAVSDLPTLPPELIILVGWLANYYASGIGAAANLVVSSNNLKPEKSLSNRQKNPKYQASKLPPLTVEQRETVDQITSPGTYLLHGETGSGKTRVYIELAKKAVSDQKSVIILTPEIGLTSQLEDQFRLVFAQQVLVTHSSLTLAERRLAWQKILTSNQPLVVIGPRSALFSPLSNVGLIVIDESHDSSYKQIDSPYYVASTVAAKLSQLHNCPLILGSATPSISDFYLAKQRQRPIIRMNQLAAGSKIQPTEIEIVDIRNRVHYKRSQYISDQLLKEIRLALDRGEQSLLFLNRRGTARVTICANCDWTATCPHCNLPLTYHADSHNLRCHTCSYSEPSATSCPVCTSPDINYKSVGTKAIETDIKRLFPKAKVKRFDSDNPKADRLESLYDEIRDGKVDIIIGTQAVAKGLDLPKLAAVGIIQADTSLYLPDYLANEQTYQLIRQVVGRVGRGHRQGTVIVQTYTPESQTIRAATSGDYARFYQMELAEREKFNFPPATHMLKLTVRRATSLGAEKAASKIKTSLVSSGMSISIEGPSPCFHELSGGKYCWQLVVKSPSRAELLAVVKLLPSDTISVLDPLSLL